MIYIENESFVNNELIPFIDDKIGTYLEGELDYAETLSDIENMLDINCPDDLKEEIIVDIKDLIIECIDDYDIIESNDEENLETLSDLIDSEFETVKKDILSLKLEDEEKDSFFDEYGEEY